ncbi:Kynureninase 2 [Podosphaera aphanis]|nr:Kynureninase 2 [Podosphaera aphanis]
MPLEVNSNSGLSSEDEQSRDYALSLDSQCPLRHSRDLFLIPAKNQLRLKDADTFSAQLTASDDLSLDSIYLCGNSLGLQPQLTSTRIQQYLVNWATQGVNGHFNASPGSHLPPWVDADVRASESIAPILGALPTEVAVMQTLTANLHLLLSAFYKPDLNGRHKIVVENHAFPSDHFAAESQIKHHRLNPETSLVLVKPPVDSHTISTSQILSLIETHATTIAILLLPGIQYYTGQLLDIPTITAAAHRAGIFVIWDLAHAIGNVSMNLHDWNVDAAVWCSYKYLNSGPGATGGLFIHDKHTQVSTEQIGKKYVDRLSGWWGSEKASRFAMDGCFEPIHGAAGFQLSNPSILDNTSILASLEIFATVCSWDKQNSYAQQGILPLRNKSVRLTNYLEAQLRSLEPSLTERFKIITPADSKQRGAQLSLKLEFGLLGLVMKELEKRGVVVDERQPDVIRVAPAPLYNTFQDCWFFVQAFGNALKLAVAAKNE